MPLESRPADGPLVARGVDATGTDSLRDAKLAGAKRRVEEMGGTLVDSGLAVDITLPLDRARDASGHWQDAPQSAVGSPPEWT